MKRPGRIKKIYKWGKARGLLWVVLYILLWLARKSIVYIEKFLIGIERHKFLTGEGTVSSSCHTVEENLKRWDSCDWSHGGEQWTLGVKLHKGQDPAVWKNSLIEGAMLKYIKNGSTVLEIGPGAGRWTEVLVTVAKRLVIADISEECLKTCKERFKHHSNIEYHLIGGCGLDFIENNSIDYIWAYDVFPHINPTDTENYIVDFKRILKSGGYGIIQHAGTYPNRDEDWVRRVAFRSYVDGKFFAHLIKKHNMIMVEQNNSLVNMPGDLISVFRKP